MGASTRGVDVKSMLLEFFQFENFCRRSFFEKLAETSKNQPFSVFQSPTSFMSFCAIVLLASYWANGSVFCTIGKQGFC